MGERSRGQKLNTIFVFQTFRAPPGYPSKNPGIYHQKVWFHWVTRDKPNFLAPTPWRADPHPTGRYPEPKVWVCATFASLTKFLYPFLPQVNLFLPRILPRIYLFLPLFFYLNWPSALSGISNHGFAEPWCCGGETHTWQHKDIPCKPFSCHYKARIKIIHVMSFGPL